MKAVILEVQAGQGQDGQKAEVRLDSNPDRVFKGVIISLGGVFRVKSDSQPAIVFDALIDLSESDPGLMRPGMAAGVDITISSKENVLQVPEAAIVYQENRLAVRKKRAFSEDLIPVTVGARSSGMVEILERARGERCDRHPDRIRGGRAMKARPLLGMLIVSAAFAAAACGGPKNAAMAVLRVHKGTFQVVIPAFGEVQAASPRPSPFRIESQRFGIQTISWMAPEYSSVKKGEVVIRLASTDLKERCG